MLLAQDVKFLKGVGEARAKILREDIGVRTVEDLLTTYPFRYIDRREVYRIGQLRAGMQYVQVKGQILYFEEEGEGRKKRLVATFTDGLGVMRLVWFHYIQSIRKRYKPRTTYIAFGVPQLFGGYWSMAHPDLEEADQNSKQPSAFAPIYHTSERMKRSGVTSTFIAGLISQTLSIAADSISETLPPYILSREGLMPRREAICQMHTPDSYERLEEAKRRLKFEELFYIQLSLLTYAVERQTHISGQRFPRIGDAFNSFYKYHLPFALTGAQKRVLHEIRHDMGSGRQMNRLLQGDVGSGKTIVALMSMLIAVDNGKQSCLMAPTEILAEQHYVTFSKMLEGMPVSVALLTSSVKGKRRDEILSGLASGKINILIGTHALIEDTVVFATLGLAVIDEQHRFGVAQRAKLWTKTVTPPHVLVMTATPIPRTLAMTVYGDLNVSVLDELPPGRKPVHTVRVGASEHAKVYRLMREEIAKGRQVYYVFPLIKENEKMDLKDLENGYRHLCEVFPDLKLGFIHGRLKTDDKSAVMQAFADGEIDILVATTVIEVGVNVSNATIMVIESAQRFGLSQLHQLRGRVGRGGDQSYCVLVTPDNLSGDSMKRMEIMTSTTDGFKIAEEDLQLRGPGDLQGTMQSGIPFNLKIANLVTDGNLLEEARRLAHEVISADPDHTHSYNEILWKNLKNTHTSDIRWEEIS